MEATAPRKVEGLLVAALTTLTAAALIVVEMTPRGYDEVVWWVWAVLLAGGGGFWRLQHWPARPWVVLVASVGLVVVGYAMWLWWYSATRPPQGV